MVQGVGFLLCSNFAFGRKPVVCEVNEVNVKGCGNILKSFNPKMSSTGSKVRTVMNFSRSKEYTVKINPRINAVL